MTRIRTTLLVALLALPLRAQPAIDWEKEKNDAITKLREYVRIDTTNPPGNEIRGVEYLRRVLQAEGIPFESGESAAGRGSIVARLKGSGHEPALVLLSHIDVVPATRQFWTVDPFGAEIREGYLWGRGSVDTKALGIAELEAVLLLHRLRVPLRRDVIFLATADEEAGGAMGAGWVVKSHPEWISGAGFLINEVGRARADEKGQPWYYLLGTTEKTPAWLKLTAKGPSRHASLPSPDSAVNRLVAALERLRTRKPPLEVTAAVERSLRTRAPYEPEPWRSRFANIRDFVKTNGAYEELLKRPPILALLMNTVNITLLEGSSKINIVPPSASAQLDCRLLPGTTLEQWTQEVRRTIADDSIAIDVVLNFPPSESPPDTPLGAAIKAAVQRVHRGIGLAEEVTAGFTDSHFFRENAIVSYGFSPFPMNESDLARVHGNDERIPVASFGDGVRVMWELVYDFARADVE